MEYSVKVVLHGSFLPEFHSGGTAAWGEIRSGRRNQRQRRFRNRLSHGRLMKRDVGNVRGVKPLLSPPPGLRSWSTDLAVDGRLISRDDMVFGGAGARCSERLRESGSRSASGARLYRRHCYRSLREAAALDVVATKRSSSLRRPKKGLPRFTPGDFRDACRCPASSSLPPAGGQRYTGLLTSTWSSFRVLGQDGVNEIGRGINRRVRSVPRCTHEQIARSYASTRNRKRATTTGSSAASTPRSKTE